MDSLYLICPELFYIINNQNDKQVIDFVDQKTTHVNKSRNDLHPNPIIFRRGNNFRLYHFRYIPRNSFFRPTKPIYYGSFYLHHSYIDFDEWTINLFHVEKYPYTNRETFNCSEEN